MTLVFATHNQNKVRELNEILSSNTVIKSLHELGFSKEIEETASTIEDNSELKATAVFDELSMPTIADDSGLEVDHLEGAPGVYSARYAGKEKDDQANISKLLDDLADIQHRGAQFKTVITLKTSFSLQQFTGIVRGQITESQRGEKGFGYDPIFIPEGYDRTFAEMNSEEKNAISHRSIAVRKLLDYLGHSF